MPEAIQPDSGEGLGSEDEPTDLAARVVDCRGDVWAGHPGQWACLTRFTPPLRWDLLVETCSPLRLVEPAPGTDGAAARLVFAAEQKGLDAEYLQDLLRAVYDYAHPKEAANTRLEWDRVKAQVIVANARIDASLADAWDRGEQAGRVSERKQIHLAVNRALIWCREHPDGGNISYKDGLTDAADEVEAALAQRNSTPAQKKHLDD